MQNYASLASIYLDAPFCSQNITVEARLQRGLPRFQINGLVGSHSSETSNRIRNAICASGVRIPYMSLLVNLAPVDLRKQGAYLDLSIAICILLALKKDIGKINPILLPTDHAKTLYLGELSLSGRVVPVNQIYALLWEASKKGFEKVVLPKEQCNATQLIPGIQLIPISHLQELLDRNFIPIHSQNHLRITATRPKPQLEHLELSPRTQKALALCTAGWHSLLLIGPPGSGKTSLAHELLALLPPPSHQETLEIIIGKYGKEYFESYALENENIRVSRPLCAPHHSSSKRGIIGGGSPIQPGEISHAHAGVLVLDELGEFSRETLQALREPMQERKVNLSKGKQSIILPSRFLLCATSNPCPCGDLKNRFVHCHCTNRTLKNYTSKFMGALRDRIDLEVWVDRNPIKIEGSYKMNELIAKIERAQEIQARRFSSTHLRFNSDVGAKELEAYFPLENTNAKQEWNKLKQNKSISYRALAGTRRLARTLADLAEREQIRAEDVLEAASYRCIDSRWNEAAGY